MNTLFIKSNSEIVKFPNGHCMKIKIVTWGLIKTLKGTLTMKPNFEVICIFSCCPHRKNLYKNSLKLVIISRYDKNQNSMLGMSVLALFKTVFSRNNNIRIGCPIVRSTDKNKSTTFSDPYIQRKLSEWTARKVQRFPTL